MTDVTGQAAPPYVLVVDDDPGIRALLQAALEGVGYRVVAAESAEAALPLFDQECPDALVVDLIMPGLSGDALARRVHERCPDTHLIFVSGFPAEQLRDLGVTQVVFLTKPISIRELREMLKRLLGR